MKLVPVNKPDKRKKNNVKKSDNDVISLICDDIVIFPIYGQFGAVQKLDSRHIVYNTYIFINSNL